MPVPPDHRAVLLSKARQDHHVAALLAQDRSVADEIIGFHCQQAIEKPIKAVFAARNIEYPLTHDLTRLLTLLADQAIVFPSELTSAAELTAFAVRLRYDELPIAETDEPAFDRAMAIALAAFAIQWADSSAASE